MLGFKPSDEGVFTVVYRQQAVVKHAAENAVEPQARCFVPEYVVVREVAPSEQQGIAAYGFAVCRLVLIKIVARQAEQNRQRVLC